MLSGSAVKTFFKTTGNSLPRIDVDHFSREALIHALTEYGTYELVGESIDKLREPANLTMEEEKRMLHLPIETLAEYDHKGSFNGFQNVREQTEGQVKAKKGNTVRQQIAFHYKPYLTAKVPAGISEEIFRNYYQAAHAILLKHYGDIAREFLHEDVRSNLTDDNKSVLMMRRYFSKDAQPKQTPQSDNLPTHSTTGIPPHSDHGLVTLVTSDAPGLEALRDNTWIAADHTPGTLRFFINFGDWALFQLLRSITLDPARFQQYKFREGLHRVPHVETERHSLILALNPRGDEVLHTPKAGPVSYDTFLQSPKSLYRDTSRDESANTMATLVEQLRPKQPQKINKPLPKLYVAEAGCPGQDSWIMVNGADRSLTQRANEKFSFAYTDAATAKENTEDRDHSRLFEINLTYANDIYVIDSLANEPATTRVPLSEYKDTYQSPVFLIQRPLLVDEAKQLDYSFISALK